MSERPAEPGPNEDAEIVQVHVPLPGEFESLLSCVTEIDELEASREGGRREVLLSRGGDISFERGEPYTFQAQGDHFRAVIPDARVALGYYLHGLEQNGVMEDDAYERAVDAVPWCEHYLRWIKGLTPRDRKLRLLDLAEWRAPTDFVAETYLDDQPCTWGSTNLSESGRALARDIASEIDVKPQMCYYTAQHAAMLHAGNHRVSYHEGLALPKQASQCVRHAWIEIDGEVAELTWPWHFFDGAEAQYFGVEIPTEQVEEARERRDVNGPIILSDEEVRTSAKAMAGQT